LQPNLLQGQLNTTKTCKQWYGISPKSASQLAINSLANAHSDHDKTQTHTSMYFKTTTCMPCHAMPQCVDIGTNTDDAFDGAHKLITWVESQLLDMESGSSLGLHQWVATSQQTVAPSPPAS